MKNIKKDHIYILCGYYSAVVFSYLTSFDYLSFDYLKLLLHVTAASL